MNEASNTSNMDLYEMGELLGPEFQQLLINMGQSIAAIEGGSMPLIDMLREKDNKLVDTINDYLRELKQFFVGHDITKTETILFAKILLMFIWTELILFELKGGQGWPPGLPDPQIPPDLPQPK